MVYLSYTFSIQMTGTATMDNARIENENIIFPSSAAFGNGPDLTFPLELLEAISKLGTNSYKLDEAVMFYKITKDAPDWRWVIPEELEGKNLAGWEIYYYESNWEDSCWSNIWLTQEVKLNAGTTNYTSFDFAGEEHSWTFEAGQSLLLVKLSDADFAERVAREEERDRQNREYIAQREAEEQARIDNPNSEEDPLEAWEKALLEGE